VLAARQLPIVVATGGMCRVACASAFGHRFARPSLLTHVNIMAAVHHLIPQCVNAWICDCGCPLNPSALGPHSELLPDIPNIHPYILVFLSSVARLFARGN